MKTTNIFLVIIIICFSYSQVNAQLKVSTNGNVGIGNYNPSYKLDVKGTARFDAWSDIYIDWSGTGTHPSIYPERNSYLRLGKSDKWLNHMWCYSIDYQTMVQHSDISVKTNIQNLSGVLSKIEQINVYNYNYNDEYYKDLSDDLLELKDRKKFGFIAQEFEQVFPDLVYNSQSGMTKNSTLKSIDYISVIPILVQAIKEQQTQIEELSQKIQSLESLTALNEQKSKSDLLRNYPNPFSKETNISLVIPETAEQASILIYDSKGTLVKEIEILDRGKANLTFQAANLDAGVYSYTLIADSKVINTNKMIIQK
ncbi:MAG: tail fiber domain-containing protein [Bacteroidales bacterium]|jgi:hypothetical protein